MKREIVAGVALAVLALAIGMVWWQMRGSKQQPGSRPPMSAAAPTSAPTPSQSANQPGGIVPPNGPEQLEDIRRQGIERQQRYEQAFRTPISFWGAVVDHRGAPVPKANVVWSVRNRPDGDPPKHQAVTDDNGRFSITAANGLGLTVSVSKEGYSKTVNSSVSLAYADQLRPGNSRQLPTPDNPTTLSLYKKGEAEPLTKVQKYLRVPKDGSPVEIDLETGKAAGSSGDFRIECWTHVQTKDEAGRYDWRCRVSVPGGGLIEREDPLAFEAPEAGYRKVDEITMEKAAAQWRSQVRRDYFLQLNDGRFARVSLEVITHGDHLIAVTSFLNPSGSRNLEYDPNKQVSAR